MPPKSRGVTSVDVARAAGVSQTTVSRIVNGHEGVSERVRAKVEAAIQQLDYRPNLSARSLVTSRTQTIGVVLGDPRNSYYAELLHTISDDLNRAGYRALILSGRADTTEDLARTLRETNVDGVILTTTLLSPDDEGRIVSLGVPAVTMGPGAVPDNDSISPDNVDGGRIAGRHLASLGHRRIGVIAGPLGTTSVRDRHEGFLSELEAAGVVFDPSLLDVADLDYTRAFEAATRLLQLPEPPTALFCHNDLVAFGALNAAKALGIGVPDEVSVLGFDDVAMSSWQAFDLTTVRQPILDMAHGAVELLLARLAAPEQDAAHVLLPCSLVERSTTRAL
ncbi:LacI family DNA-binding transcriptional regulator [Microbacterium sp. ISL-59]|uniref:LacI family DNA-binding transcriptional regulator n=1 Tax=Microbacterium sp. ISL-59 TaxID=2819159 RepID=UPI001BE9EAA0|nr:LacI family DNA-binding transcriptional regulator [Microbacterium sp. ISL-59]MBT2496353.1 LacI family DNA-binding transcriptional regulator [Microbacterium sp. ISL-59]